LLPETQNQPEIHMPKYKSLFLLLGLLTGSASAQQGHPMVGTWQGYWGVDDSDSNFMTLILNWDGKELSGLLNPGPGSTELGSMTLDSSDWTVTLETDLTDDDGTLRHINAEGKLDKVGSMNRTLEGTWRSAEGSGSFSLERQSGP
jgi:hypothetical protein